MDLDDSLEGHLFCATREHLLSRLSVLLLESRVQTWMKKDQMNGDNHHQYIDLDDYDLNKLLTGDRRLWYTRTFAFELVYRYYPCLQGGASPAE